MNKNDVGSVASIGCLVTMKILQTQTLRGPNYWSVSCSKLIVILLDLEELDDSPSATLAGFQNDLLAVLPNLKEKLGDLEYRDACLGQELKSSMLGHVLKDVALELQTLSGMPVAFGSACETASPGAYQVAIEYQIEKVGRYAIRAALRLCQSLIERGSYPASELKKDLEDLQELRADAAQGASTEALLQEAEQRGIPWTHIENCDLFQLGYGQYQKRIKAALTSRSNVLGVELACDKEQTKTILESMGAPVPKGQVIYAFRELRDAIRDLGGYPIVIKPLDGNQGRGITIDIRSWQQADIAYDRAKEVSDGVIVEHFYRGRDHRILVVNHKVVAVAERVPAHVVGNGQDSIFALVQQENQDVRRGKGHDTPLTQIKLDAATDELLGSQGFTLDTVLEAGQICYLRANANLSTGGTAIDRTEEIHPNTVWLAERASRIIDLDIVGIDVITTDITQPLKDMEGVIVEVNAAPGLRMHMAPSEGMARNVAAPILDMLFPAKTPTRIPVVAVAESGDDGATPLIAHLLSPGYGAVGYTALKGAYISDRPIKKGDATNAQSAALILQDPTVDIAVLATSHRSILRSGLAVQHCDVGVVFNVAADYAGLSCTLDYKTRALSVIAQAVDGDGYAILNGDDGRVAAMAHQVRGKVAYFSVEPENSVLRAHVQQGGLAASYNQDYLAIFESGEVRRIEQVENLPSTVRGGKPDSMAYVLAAILVAYVQGVSIEQIRAALQTYQASAQQRSAPTDWPNNNDKPDLPGSISPLINLGNFAIAATSISPQVEAALPQFSQSEQLSSDLSTAASPAPLATQAKKSVVADVAAAQTAVAAATALAEALESQSSTPTEQPQTERPQTEQPPTERTQGIRRQVESFQSKVVAAEARLGRVQQAFTAMSQAIEQREIKDWAANRGSQLLGWVKAAAPLVLQWVNQALGWIMTVSAIAFVFGRAGVIAMFEIVQEVGSLVWEKLEIAAQPVPSTTIDPALKDVMTLFGKDGQRS